MLVMFTRHELSTLKLMPHIVSKTNIIANPIQGTYSYNFYFIIFVTAFAIL